MREISSKWGDSCIKVSMGDLTEKDLQEIEDILSPKGSYSSSNMGVTDDYNLEFYNSYLADYHKGEYNSHIFIIVTPEPVKMLLQKFEDRIAKRTRRQIKEVLGIGE